MRQGAFLLFNDVDVMKVAVAGCGAVGSYYGAKLAQAGHEVHFLLRSDYEKVRRSGVFIRSPAGDFRARPLCALRPNEIGIADVVLVALKTTANLRFEELLSPLVGPTSVVITLQNGLGNEELLAKIFPAKQIMGALCFVCLNRLKPGLIQHLGHGQIVLGEFRGKPGRRARGIADAFQNAGVPSKVSSNLAKAHWEKLVWNIPFNGLGVASSAGLDAFARRGGKLPARLGPCLTTEDLLRSGEWSGKVKALMLEVIAIARALGFKIPRALADKQIERTRSMGPYRASTLIDFERCQPLELKSLFLEPLRLAKSRKVAVPQLEALCRILKAIDPGRTHRAKKR